jgi:hypothetical protein
MFFTFKITPLWQIPNLHNINFVTTQRILHCPLSILLGADDLGTVLPHSWYWVWDFDISISTVHDLFCNTSMANSLPGSASKGLFWAKIAYGRSVLLYKYCVGKGKGIAVPLQAWSGPEGSRKLRFPDFMTTAQDGGKVVSLTHRPPLPPGNTPGTHFC